MSNNNTNTNAALNKNKRIEINNTNVKADLNKTINKRIENRNIERLSIRLLGNVFTVDKLKNALEKHFSTKHLLILNKSTKENLLKIKNVKNVMINSIEKDEKLREKLLHGIIERKKANNANKRGNGNGNNANTKGENIGKTSVTHKNARDNCPANPQLDEELYMKCKLGLEGKKVEEIRHNVYKFNNMVIKGLEHTNEEGVTVTMTTKASILDLGAEYIGHEKHGKRIYLKTKFHAPFKPSISNIKNVESTFDKIYNLAVKISDSELKYHPDFHKDNIVIRNNELVMIDWDGYMYTTKPISQNKDENLKKMLRRYVGYEFQKARRS
jgi:hypothetical protein